MAGLGLLATTFASRIGACARSRNSLVDQLPPIIAHAQDIQIDLAPLILYGEFFIDEEAFEAITQNRYSRTRRLAGQMRDFWEAGVLKTQSFSNINPELSAAIIKNTELEIGRNRDFWLSEIKKSILWWEEERINYIAAYGKKYALEGKMPFAIKSVLQENDLPLSEDNEILIRQAVFDHKDPDHFEVTRSAMTAFLNYASTTRLQSDMIGCPAFHWNDLQEFVSAQDRVAARRQGIIVDTAKYLITDIAEIDTRNVSNTALIALLNDPKVKDVRKLVFEAVNEGRDTVLLDKDAIYSRLRSKYLEVNRKSRTRFAVKLVKAAIGGNSTLVGALAGILDTESPLGKTIDDFLKSTVLDAQIASNSTKADRVIKAVVVLSQYLDQQPEPSARSAGDRTV